MTITAGSEQTMTLLGVLAVILTLRHLNQFFDDDDDE